ncbi:hypothetical protein FRC07_007586 [Ceratobasidium sp. 392]|nr:hypothetical protein FRC07_007586 [Ceratobasidium sp. 392]
MDGAHQGEGVPVGQEKEAQKSEKQAVMDRMQGPKQKPTDAVKNKRGERTVKDPTTGQMVTIKDAEFKDYPSQSELDPASGHSGPATQSVTGDHKLEVPSKFRASNPAPAPAHPGNISLQPYPPSRPPYMDTIMSSFDRLQMATIGSSAIIWFFTAFGHGLFGFFFRSTLIFGLGFAVTTLASLIQRSLEKEVERVRLDMHRQRGEKFSPPTPESVEWLNAFTKTIWGLVNPDMFVPIADTIEDVMQQSLPGLVDAVRISDIGQGTNPFRIISMRALPDQPGDKEYPREEWIDQGTNELMERANKAREAGQDADQAGDYVNFEVAFAYSAEPGKGSESRSKNIHLLIEFFMGVYDWLHIPIPIWIQVDGIVGTVRLRIQFIPEPPFVRNLTFTLMGVPGVEVSAIPMSKVLPNLLDLPLISRFVKMAIAAGTAELVAPKSMTLNIQEMMSGAALGDTLAEGVFLITIHHAEDLSAQDRNGKSDPYIVLAYAKFGKPLYSTRIVLGDLNPVFEETAALLLTRDEVKAEEDLGVMLWDSDKRSAERVKQYTTQPFFEAGTEVFVRDWQKAIVRIVVRDSKLREKDPILGIVSLDLTKLLKDASEVTQLFALQEGIGFGRMNVSILFKAVDAKLPRNMLGWDTGTVEILSDVIVTPEHNAHGNLPARPTKLTISTTDSTEHIPAKSASLADGRHSYTVDMLRLPVYSRYNSSCVFEFGGGGVMGGAPDAIAVLWLKDIVDDEETEIRVPVVVGKDLKQLRQNVLNEQTAKTHNYEVVGWLTTKIKLDAGLDEDHEKHAVSQARRHAFETYDHIEGEALIAERNAHFADDGNIDKKEQKELDAAQKRQLHNRQRGIAGIRVYRTAQWMKQGVKSRLMPKKSSAKREPTVKSEA